MILSCNPFLAIIRKEDAMKKANDEVIKVAILATKEIILAIIAKKL